MCTYHGDHAVTLLPGSAAAKEGDEEDDDPHHDEDQGGWWGRDIIDHYSAVESHLNQNSQHYQSQTTQLARNKWEMEERVKWIEVTEIHK